MISKKPNTRIKKLSPLLINQLSAGEVVTRPASVVKELLENAIDAGATDIHINITQGGMGLIEITDNGSGIHPDDMLMAITRHATSKVADVEQLHGISTLGFRGEALASVSAVSRLTITSSHDDSGVGRCLAVAGKIDRPDISPVVCQKGTTIAVRDLYFNVPARRGNLKSISTEYAHIEAVIRHVALVYANIHLTLYHEGRCRLKLLANNQQNNQPITAIVPSISRLQQAIATPLPDNAYNVSIDLACLLHGLDGQNCMPNDTLNTVPNIDGWIWLDDTDTSDFDLEGAVSTRAIDLPKLIYMNGRLVKDNTISQLVRQTLQSLTLLPKNLPKKVGYALFFTLPTEWLNLNVHPSKQRINVHALANINVHLQNGLKKLLSPIVEVMTAQEVKNNEKIQKTAISQKTENTCDSIKANINLENNVDANVVYQTNKPTRTSQVSAPKSVYQLDNQKSSNSNIQNESNEDEDADKTENIKLRLIVWTKNQNSKSKADKLASLLCHEFNIEENFTVEKYAKINHSYRIDIFMSVEANHNITKHMIKLADSICNPWTVTYNHDTDEISLSFIKTESTHFREITFHVIERASFDCLV